VAGEGNARKSVKASDDGGSSAGYEAARAWHLAESPRDELVTAFEFSMMQAFEAYQRWCVQGARLVGHPDIAYNEVVVLHVVRMQERAKDAATIAKLVNRDDLPNVLYNLRKLVSIGLVEKVKIGSGTFFQVTERGRIETERYAALRRDLLLDSMEQVANLSDKLQSLVGLMHVMTGLYDGAARETATINPAALFPDDEVPAPAKKSPARRAKPS
jgi:predicted MarR family transcription regulator